MTVEERMKLNRQITALENKIRKLDHFHHDSIEDYRNGGEVDLGKIGRSIRSVDKMRIKLEELRRRVRK